MTKKLRKIAVMTSGGDAPGMNAAIRAVVRTAIDKDLEVVGIERGYAGLLNSEFRYMNLRSVSNILQRGGTTLRTSRSPEFKTPEGRAKAASILASNKIDGLVVIGGDGSFRGAHALAEEHRIRVVGIPGTIDNDLFGTDFTIGYDTAVNTAVEAIDKIKDTAASHDRLFVVEVMGRSAGFIALETGISIGAEKILLPERQENLEDLYTEIRQARQRGKMSAIIIVAEGDETGGAYELSSLIRENLGLEFRVCILGHLQRGGSPSSFDRNLASKLGYWAVMELLADSTDIMIGIRDGKKHTLPLAEALNKSKELDGELLELNRILSQ